MSWAITLWTVVTAHDGTKTLTLNLPTTQFPNAPHVSNFSAAQSISSAADFTLIWDPFVGGTTNDFIQVSVAGLDGTERFRTPDIGFSGAPNGTATSIIIPANTTAPGQTYHVELSFYKITTRDPTNYPGALGVVGFGSRTKLSVSTTAISRPNLTAPSRFSPSQFQFRLRATPSGLTRSNTPPTWFSAVLDPHHQQCIRGL